MQAASNAVQSYLGKEESEVVGQAEQKSVPGQTMKALVWIKPGQVEVQDVPIPDVTQDEDVILEVTGSTICGSDLHLYNKGDILGHEFMGRVYKRGSKVTNLEKGQRVVVSFQIACGECEYCKQKLSSFCDRTNDSSLMQTASSDIHFTGGFAGGQAEYVRVPKGHVNCLPIPDELSDEQVIYLSDVLPTSYHCVVDTGVQEGDTVAIWGLGPIGAAAARWCQLKGAKRIIGIDQIPSRLERVKKLGCEVIDFSKHTGKDEVPKVLLEMTNGRGVDVALDCGTFHEPKGLLHKAQKLLMLETDNPETVNECIKSVRKMGRVGLIAAYAAFANGLNLGAVMEKGVRLIGNGQAPVHKYWKEIMNDYIATGKFDVSWLVTHRVPIEECVPWSAQPDVRSFALLYDRFQKRVAGVEKVFVETKFSSPPATDKGFPTTTRVKDWPLEVE